jgi:class 3 adenylate cyclase
VRGPRSEPGPTGVRIDPFGLGFDRAEDEQRFRREYDRRAARSSRLAISVGAPGYLLMLVILDDPRARAVAVAMLVVLAAWIALAWTRWYPHLFLPATVIGHATLAVLSMLLFRQLPAASAVIVAIAFITLNFMWIAVFLRPRFPWVVATGVGYLAIVVLGGAGIWDDYGGGVAPPGMIDPLGGMTGGVLLLLLYAGFLLVLTSSVAYRLELAEREAFLQDAALDAAHRRTEELLLNTLPAPIAERLRAGEQPIVDDLEEVSVVFADIVDFTQMAASLDAGDVLALLNDVFTRFDRLAADHGLEKIKTIGDAYMAVAGAPHPVADHATAAVEMALDMVRTVASVRRPDGAPVVARVGVASGPAVAGVIGAHKFSYDLWGDTVNTASRMESHGTAGRVHVADSTRQLLGDRYLFEDRGIVEVKGKGPMHTWLLLGRRADTTR